MKSLSTPLHILIRVLSKKKERGSDISRSFSDAIGDKNMAWTTQLQERLGSGSWRQTREIGLME